MKDKEKMYICVEQNKNKALYYATNIGRTRVYRQSYPLEHYMFNGKDINKGLKLLTYKNKNNAQKLCNEINKEFNSNYEVVEV